MDSFRRRLNEIKRVTDEDVYRKRVLLLCQQQEPKSFDEYSSSGSFRRLEKFESSTYSEVLRAIDLADNNKPVVMKIMRALSKGVIRLMPSITTRGCQAYNDILNELVVTQALSQLHDGVILNGQPNALFRTHFFCLIHEIKVVSGNLSRTLSRSKPRKTPKAPLLQVQELANAENANQTREGPKQKEPPGQAELVADTTSSLSQNTNTDQSQATTSNVSNLSSGFSSKNGPSLSQSNNVVTDSSAATGSSETATTRQDQDQDKRQDQEEQDTKSDQIKDEELRHLPEEERMLMEALPHEYVVSVMRHDGQPLWWMMTHKKLNPQQLTSVLIQVIVGLAIAENVYLYEHRDLHVSNILIKKTSNESIPFILDGRRYTILSQGIKATIIDATFSRMTHNGKVYYRDLTSTLRAYGTKKTPIKMSLQNRSYRQMVRVTKNKWDDFTPKTNLIWLTYLCETLMKNETMKGDPALSAEVKKIRDYTLKVKTTYDLLGCFPFKPAQVDASLMNTTNGNQAAPTIPMVTNVAQAVDDTTAESNQQ